MNWIDKIKDNKKSGYYNLLYEILWSTDILIIALQKIKHKNNLIKKNKKTLLSDLDHCIINKIKSNLKYKSFKFISAKKIDKKLISLTQINNKIVIKAILMILEIIYETKFSKFSYNGHILNKNAHSSLKEVSYWTNTTWIIQGSINNTFSRKQIQKTIWNLEKSIKDDDFINLIWNLLNISNVTNKKLKSFSESNVNAKNLIFSMLFNVYLDDLDFFIENLINKSSYDQESYYIFQKLNLINQKSQKKVISMLKVTSFLNNKKFNKSNIKPMINYIRYINTWILGITSNRILTMKIKTQINEFLEKKLFLTLNSYKTKINDMIKQKVNFLGFFLSISPQKQLAKKHINQNFKIKFHLPMLEILKKMINKGFLKIKKIKHIKRYVPLAINNWIFLDHKTILLRYNEISKKLFDYYYFVDNITQFWRLSYFFLRHSCAKTLARKFNLPSRAAVFKKFGNNLLKT